MAETTLADRTTNLLTPTTADNVAQNQLNTDINSSSQSIVTTSSSNSSNVVPEQAHAANSNVILAMDFLRTNSEIQRQIDSRFIELQNSH